MGITTLLRGQQESTFRHFHAEMLGLHFVFKSVDRQGAEGLSQGCKLGPLAS